MSLRYNDFIALLTKAIQEQQEIIDDLKKENKQQNIKIESQSTDIKSLLSRMQKIENATRINQLVLESRLDGTDSESSSE